MFDLFMNSRRWKAKYAKSVAEFNVFFHYNLVIANMSMLFFRYHNFWEMIFLLSLFTGILLLFP